MPKFLTIKIDNIHIAAFAYSLTHSILPFLLLTSFLLLSGCSRKAIREDVLIDQDQRFSNSGLVELPERWWTAFQDTSLNRMIDTALANNFNLKAAWERLQASNAIYKRASASIIPNISSSVQSGLNFPQPDFVGGENVRLNLTADYEIDLWGRIRSQIEAEKFRANASLADYQAAAISLSAEIARTWYQLQEAKQQLELIEQQINTNQNILELLKSRFGTGQIRGVDIIRQKQLIKGNEEQKVITESNIKTLEHQLLVLLGQSPMEEFVESLDSFPQLPPLPETGIPIELVRRRPDIRAAFLRLQAADQDVAAAISNRYPRLAINASTSLRSNNFNNIFKNWAYSFAGSLFAPLFYGGELLAEVDRTKAVKNQFLYQYGQSVLTAFQEVEDALILEQKQKERIQVIQNQIELVQQTNKQLRVEYFNGSGNYLDVLTALSQEQQLRRDLVTANRNLLEFRIALYRALAGEF